MRSVLLRIDPDTEDSIVAELWQCGTSGIVEENGTLRAYFDESAELDSFLSRYSDVLLEDCRDDSTELSTISLDDWAPVLAGDRFFIVPPWLENPAPSGRMRLVIDTTRAFETGRHESTQLMIEALEQTIRPGQTVVDVGCGSGILSAIAKMLGAAEVFSCDVDPNAIEETRKLVDTPLFCGSVNSLCSSVADVVLANITCPILESIAADLWRILKPGGILILSGFLSIHTPSGFRPTQVLERDDWECWICQNP